NSRVVEELLPLRLHLGSSPASLPSSLKRFLAKASSLRLTIKVAWSRSSVSGLTRASSERNTPPATLPVISKSQPAFQSPCVHFQPSALRLSPSTLILRIAV